MVVVKLSEYNRTSGPISLEDAISVIKQIDPDHDMTISYRAESTILKAVAEGRLVVRDKEK